MNTQVIQDRVSLTFDQVCEMLPQKFPLIMVDRVLSCDKGRTIECLKNISGNDLLLTGHFPGMAIFPGALLLEGVAQSSILLHRLSFPTSSKCVHLFGAVKARFVSPVFAGDQVIYNVELVSSNGIATTFRGEASVAGRPVARCELAMSTKPMSSGVRS